MQIKTTPHHIDFPLSRSVSLEMIKFAAAYSSLLVGFMVMFMILFSEQDVFNSNFFGVFGKVITAHIPSSQNHEHFHFQGVGYDDWRV